MSGILNLLLGSAAGVIKDAYFNLVTLLLNTTATNGAQNNTFLDSSTNNFSITRNGNTTQGTFTPFSQTGWSNFFDNTVNDAISFPSNAAYSVGTGNFTVEFWLNPTAFSGNNQRFFLMGVSGTTNLSVEGQSAGTLTVVFEGSTIITYSWSPTFSNWYHIALCRVGSTVTLYINGTSVATATSSTSISNNVINVGSLTWAGSFNVKGYLSNVRFSANTAFYTAAFTPSTTPLTAISGTALLTCQSNRFVDNSSINAAVTLYGTPSVQAFSPFAPTDPYSTSVVGGSGYFDGTGDNLTAAANAAWQLGTGDFTLETWMYISTVASFEIYTVPTNGAFYWQYQNSGPQLAFGINSGSGFTSSWTPKTGTWYHVAVSRVSGTTTQYIDGVSIGSTATSLNASANTTLQIGTGGGGTFNGYFSGSRIVKGSAVYTGNFAVPTAPPTAVTNTQLLLNFTNAGIYDAAAKNVMETVSSVQVSTTQSKFAPTSIWFQAGGTLAMPNNPGLQFGTGDFTVEFFVYWNTVPTGSVGFVSGSGNGSTDIRYNGTILQLGKFNVSLDSSFAWVASTGQWYHVAMTRSGSSLRAFVDGTQIGTTATNSGTYNCVGTSFYVGTVTFGSAADTPLAYVQQYRITKGFARYTANFTAPASAFPLQ
jgi:hypothetical protein